MLHRIFCVLIGFLATCASFTVAAQSTGFKEIRSVEGVSEYRLPNGLQVLLIPDHSKPTTTVNMTYRVGSRHENYGESGMAHLLEHLLFKGSRRHQEVWSEFTRRGLAANGSTWFDRTNYYASFAANEDNLRWYLGWQADAMIHSFIAQHDLDSEMTVVRNEMEMGENSPDRILFEKTLSAMYQWHHYGKSTIGARTDVEHVDITRLRQFYRRYYQPDNATLIVSGKFNPTQVLRWIVADFGVIKRPRRALPVQHTLDPVQDGERQVTVRRVGGVPLLNVAYHVPPAASADSAAIELINLIMGDTPSGRLHQQLTEQQLATSAFAYAPGLAEPGFTVFGAQLSPGQDPDLARRKLLSVLESVAQTPFSEEELKRAKIKWLKAWELAFANPETVGVALSESVAQGDWRLFFLMRDRVSQLSLADVQRVAEQRLLASNRTVGLYLPTEQPVRAPAPAHVDVTAELETFRPQAAAASAEAFEATPAHIDHRTQRFEVQGLKCAVLAKGARGGTVHAMLVLRFGNPQSLFGSNQVAALTAALLEHGTRQLSRQQVQDQLDELHTELSFSSTPGVLTVHMVSRKAALEQAIALLAQMLRSPLLPLEGLEELRRQALSDLERQRKEPDALAVNALDRLANPYRQGDVRYAQTFDELEQDLKAVTLEQLQAFHQRFYGAAHAEFSAVGEVELASLKRALHAGFSDWRSSEPYARVDDPYVALPQQRLEFQTPDKQNAVMRMRLALPLSDSHADYPALMLANHLLGGGASSRLWRRIREVQGLSYDVRSSLRWNPHEAHSEWQVSAIFAPENRAKVETAFDEELARALQHGFTPQELAQGQQALLALRRLARSQDENLAASLASNLKLKRSFELSARVDDALSKLTVQQLHEALRRHLQPSGLARVFAGDFKAH